MCRVSKPRRATGNPLRGCRSPASASTCRCPTWTGPSTTWSRPTSTRPPSPGCGSRSASAGQLIDGWLLERVGRVRHQGKLAWLERSSRPSRSCARKSPRWPGSSRPLRRQPRRRPTPGRPAPPRRRRKRTPQTARHPHSTPPAAAPDSPDAATLPAADGAAAPADGGMPAAAGGDPRDFGEIAVSAEGEAAFSLNSAGIFGC